MHNEKCSFSPVLSDLNPICLSKNLPDVELAAVVRPFVCSLSYKFQVDICFHQFTPQYYRHHLRRILKKKKIALRSYLNTGKKKRYS